MFSILLGNKIPLIAANESVGFPAFQALQYSTYIMIKFIGGLSSKSWKSGNPVSSISSTFLVQAETGTSDF
jgi:hypothetical protein